MLIFQGGDQVKAVHSVGESSTSDVVNVQIGKGRNNDLALAVVHRVVEQRHMDIHLFYTTIRQLVN
jgi:hypothetical protein